MVFVVELFFRVFEFMQCKLLLGGKVGWVIGFILVGGLCVFGCVLFVEGSDLGLKVIVVGGLGVFKVIYYLVKS